MVSAARRRIVYRALKSAINRSIANNGEDIEYWIVKVSDQYEAGVLAFAQMDGLIKLGEPYLPQDDEYVDPEPESAEPESEVVEETPVEEPPADSVEEGEH